jgi:hypothetical protein
MTGRIPIHDTTTILLNYRYALKSTAGGPNKLGGLEQIFLPMSP